MIRPAELIERKRNGEELPADEISRVHPRLCPRQIPDYQVAAMLMAIFFRGLDDAETSRSPTR